MQLHGWAGPQRKKYVNVVLKTDTKYFYWGTLVLSPDRNEYENGRTVSAYVKSIIQHFGENNIIALGTDNASNMRTTWEFVRNEVRSTLFCYSCAAHALNIFPK